MSDTIRWILIGFAALLLLGIYLWGRRGARQEAGDEAPRLRTQGEPRDARVSFSVDAGGRAEVADAKDELMPHAPAPQSIRAVRGAGNDSNVHVHEEPTAMSRRGPVRIEPTLDDGHADPDAGARAFAHSVSEPSGVPATPPVTHATPAEAASAVSPQSGLSPTLGMSSTPTPRRAERRKIFALRLAAPKRFGGAQLLTALEGESLQHGKYDVFHRLNDAGASIYCVASMVEPGTFDREQMAKTEFPGVTFFVQMPGAGPGMLAFNEMLTCARRLHETLGGTLQDERGVPLTVHRIERLRQEIREFEHAGVKE